MESTLTSPEGAAASRPSRWIAAAGTGAVREASEIAAEPVAHRPTGLGELDRVLGGGLVAGGVTLIGGDPGIGKSTLLLQVMARTAAGGTPALYVTGEESLGQVVLRAGRLGLEVQGLQLLAETRVEQILALVAQHRPAALVVDSIQTLYTNALTSAPGSVSQVRETAAQLVRYAKDREVALFLVGHVTKEGSLAGPRVLEHMVDTVLYFEPEANQRYRVIRAVKNRFGAANELGIFAMTDRGLREVANPSAIFLARRAEVVPGSTVMVTREGTRPLLVEIQALVDDGQLANPRRVTVGLDSTRLSMLLAVLHRHVGTSTQQLDVYVNAVGGVRITETGADLPLLAAVVSSLRDRPVDRGLVLFAEVGLAGEIRPVPNGEERLREAAKHGFTRAVVAAGNAPRRGVEGLEIRSVKRLAEALELV